MFQNVKINLYSIELLNRNYNDTSAVIIILHKLY